MPAEEMVLETPELELEPQEVAEPTEEVVAEDPQEVVPEVKTDASDIKGDERELPQWIKNLKSVNMKEFRDAKALFFGKRDYDSKLKDFDLDGTKAFLDEHGGRESLATALGEMEGKVQEFDGFKAAAAAGDGKLVDVLAEASGQNFSKLASATNAKWAQADPEGWGQEMSATFAATIAQSNIPAFLDKMELMLAYGDTKNFGEALAQLKSWTNSFAQKAQAPRTQQNQPTNGLDVREQSIAQQERALFESDVERDVDSVRMPAIETELKAFIDRRPSDADAKELAVSQVRTKVLERLNSDKDFVGKVNALYARKDKAGAVKLINSREQAVIRDIAPKVGRAIFGQPAAPKPADPKPVVKRTATQPPVVSGNKAAKNKFDEIWAN